MSDQDMFQMSDIVSGYEIQSAMLSSKGKRTVNEDSIARLENDGNNIYVLADGLGGQGYGDVASNTVTEYVKAYALQQNDDESIDETAWIQQCFTCAQRELWKKKSSCQFGDMMTTMVLLYVGEKICWGHIGDSRLYYFKQGSLVEQTKDHSVPQFLVNVNEITPDEIRHHPDRNRLLKALGLDEEQVEECTVSQRFEIADKQAFLLCSDGFWEYILEAEMQGTLQKAGSAEEWLALMKEIVENNAQGYEQDNYSAITVWINKKNG